MTLFTNAISRSVFTSLVSAALPALLVATTPSRSDASEAGQGTFHATLVPGVGCGPGQDADIDFTSTFQFDDKTFQLNLPPGNNGFEINFSDLGVFHSQGQVHCVFDQGGTFTTTSAVNEAGDFRWIQLDGEYIDRKPGIGIGDPFPWVAGTGCLTTRTDEFKTLCDNFELSWNGLGKALAPTGGYNDFAGDLNVRAVRRVDVESGGSTVSAPATVDGPDGDVPEVEVHFRSGVAVPGELAISMLADAHGSVPAGMVHPVAGTTEIDHGSGAQPFFEGGDERFIEITTSAALSGSDIEVCLPAPAVADASEVRPVRVLHGEGSGISRKFVDRTSRRDVSGGKVCAEVSGLSRFAVVTTDVCGSGKRLSDGILSVAGGLVGRKNVIVDGLADCADFPADLPESWAELCVPDADNVAGQCSVALTLGVARAGCNEVEDGVDPADFDVDAYSYEGELRGKTATIDLEPLYHGALYALGTSRAEATVGPVVVALPVYGEKAKYRLQHELYGSEPGRGGYVRDKDSATITCVQP
jgi:hypothetical protein